MKGIQIVSTGRALPEKVITNDDLSEIVDTSKAFALSAGETPVSLVV